MKWISSFEDIEDTQSDQSRMNEKMFKIMKEDEKKKALKDKQEFDNRVKNGDPRGISKL